MVTTKFMENLLKNKDLHLLECEIEYKEDEDVIAPIQNAIYAFVIIILIILE